MNWSWNWFYKKFLHRSKVDVIVSSCIISDAMRIIVLSLHTSLAAAGNWAGYGQAWSGWAGLNSGPPWMDAYGHRSYNFTAHNTQAYLASEMASNASNASFFQSKVEPVVKF